MAPAAAAERARLFVALELPAPVRASLAGWAATELRPHGGELRLIAPEHLHVTLCFLGWRPVGEIDAIAAASRPAAPGRGLSLTVGEALWLPPRRPRVVAVALAENDGDVLARLQSELAGRLHAGGFYEPETRPFLAHVTVARVGRRARVRPVALGWPQPVTFQPPAVTLYRSRPGPGGARYEPLATVPLGGGAQGGGVQSGGVQSRGVQSGGVQSRGVEGGAGSDRTG